MDAPRIIVGKFLMDTFFKKGPQGKVTPELLTKLTQEGFAQARAGYRKGVLQIPLPLTIPAEPIVPAFPPRMFDGDTFRNLSFVTPLWKSNIVKLRNGDYLFGRFRERTNGEDPRKSVSALVQPEQLLPVQAVDAIVYHRDVLAETEPQEEGFDYEIVKVNIKVVTGEQPMPPETLIANHYQLSGGTPTNMTAQQFEAELNKSVLFWKDKAYIKDGA